MSRAKHRLRVTADESEHHTVPAIQRAVRRRERPPLPQPRYLEDAGLDATQPISQRRTIVLADPAPPVWPQRDPDLPPCGGGELIGLAR